MRWSCFARRSFSSGDWAGGRTLPRPRMNWTRSSPAPKITIRDPGRVRPAGNASPSWRSRLHRLIFPPAGRIVSVGSGRIDPDAHVVGENRNGGEQLAGFLDVLAPQRVVESVGNAGDAVMDAPGGHPVVGSERKPRSTAVSAGRVDTALGYRMGELLPRLTRGVLVVRVVACADHVERVDAHVADDAVKRTGHA